ncbi:MAG: cytochrome c1 [Alphaproteobacteria bacterium]
MLIKKPLFRVLPAKIFLLLAACLVNYPAFASGEIEPPHQEWSHRALTGTYDRAALQRGFQVYKEVCSACHSMKLLSYRNLEAIGFTPAEVKAIAAQYEVSDGPNDEGEMFNRPAVPSDRFKSPFANEKAARAANNGAYPKDLSLIVSARKHGEDYLYGLLTGYVEPPADMKMNDGMHYNKYFNGHQIAMSAPLNAGAVQFADGTENSVPQMARDVTQFLAWASDPKLEDRKRIGLQAMIFLSIFSVLMYLVKKKIWSKLDH